jgi:hypothetical protein
MTAKRRKVLRYICQWAAGTSDNASEFGYSGKGCWVIDACLTGGLSISIKAYPQKSRGEAMEDTNDKNEDLSWRERKGMSPVMRAV